MDREQLTALRDALDTLLRWPDGVLVQLAQWLGEVAKPNGHDPHPLPVVSRYSQKEHLLRQSPAPYVGKTRRGRPKISAKTAERKLLAAMADNPGLSVIALANAAGSSRSATGERLRQLALRGIVTKDITGRWKLKEAELGPRQPPSN